MTQFLPPNLLALFAPREPIPFLPPPDKLVHEKKSTHEYLGVGAFLERAGFESPEETPPPKKVETRDQRMARKRRDKEEQVAYRLEQEIAVWEAGQGEDVTTDPFKVKNTSCERSTFDAPYKYCTRFFGNHRWLLVLCFLDSADCH